MRRKILRLYFGESAISCGEGDCVGAVAMCPGCFSMCVTLSPFCFMAVKIFDSHNLQNRILTYTENVPAAWRRRVGMTVKALLCCGFTVFLLCESPFHIPEKVLLWRGTGSFITRKSPFGTAEKALSHDDKGLINGLYGVNGCALTSYDNARKTAYLHPYVCPRCSARFSRG